MAGKLHVDYASYGGGALAKMAIAPETKLAKAYAEGWRGAVVQLGGDPVTQAAYTSGAADKAGGKPVTHTAP